MISPDKVWADPELPWEEFSNEQGVAQGALKAPTAFMVSHPNPAGTCLYAFGSGRFVSCCAGIVASLIQIDCVS